MSSILTNNGAMVALQTLKSINSNLSQVQSEISTGKAVGSAKDNSALWAISKVMESDVQGFNSISESLSLGESTIAVARNGAETVTDLLTEIKGKIVASQEENVDREKIQADIDALTQQITSVVGAAQFNGLNLLQGTDDLNILSSLDRQTDGTVNAASIAVDRQSLETGAGTFGSGDSLNANVTASDATLTSTGNTLLLNATYAANQTVTANINGTAVTVDTGADVGETETNLIAAINAAGIEGVSAAGDGTGDITLSSTRAFEAIEVTSAATGGAALAITDGVGGTAASASAGTIGERAENVTFSRTAVVSEGDSYRVNVDGTNYDYVAGVNETMEDVARGLKTAIDGGGIDGVTTTVAQDDTGAWQLKVDNDTGSDITGFATSGAQDGVASGGLFGLDNIDVSTSVGAETALANVETLINNSIDAAAAFGSAQGRIETQSDFISKLTDSLKSGIGSLVDADMEEASARLQALQVQQQLGVQALSIANQAPQSILSLFR